MNFKETLKSILYREMMVEKILSRAEVKEIAKKNGFEESNAERRLRPEYKGQTLPFVTLSETKKPCKKNEHIAFYKWTMPRTVFKSYAFKNNLIRNKKMV